MTYQKAIKLLKEMKYNCNHAKNYNDPQREYKAHALGFAIRVMENANKQDNSEIEDSNGVWILSPHAFYKDTWDESTELMVYITARCGVCGKNHDPYEVYHKTLTPPENESNNYKFDLEEEKAKALEEFKSKSWNMKSFCSNCGAKMMEEKEQ